MNRVIDYKPKKRSVKRRSTLHNQAQQTIKALMITLALMIIVLSITFLSFTSESAQKGYALQQAQLKNEYLIEINENLNTKITTSTAFSAIEESDKINEMTEAELIDYINKQDNEI